MCFSPVRGIRDQSGSGEVVASCWGFASPWPPSPLPDYFPNRWDAVSRVGCLSLGIDSPPFYGPPLCPSDPVLSPHRAHYLCHCEGTCLGHVGGFFGTSWREPNPATHHDQVLEAEGNLNPYLPHLCLYSQFSLSRGDIVLQLAGFGTGEVVCCGVGSGCGACGGVGAACAFR